MGDLRASQKHEHSTLKVVCTAERQKIAHLSFVGGSMLLHVLTLRHAIVNRMPGFVGCSCFPIRTYKETKIILRLTVCLASIIIQVESIWGNTHAVRSCTMLPYANGQMHCRSTMALRACKPCLLTSVTCQSVMRFCFGLWSGSPGILFTLYCTHVCPESVMLAHLLNKQRACSRPLVQTILKLCRCQHFATYVLQPQHARHGEAWFCCCCYVLLTTAANRTVVSQLLYRCDWASAIALEGQTPC